MSFVLAAERDRKRRFPVAVLKKSFQTKISLGFLAETRIPAVFFFLGGCFWGIFMLVQGWCAIIKPESVPAAIIGRSFDKGGKQIAYFGGGR